MDRGNLLYHAETGTIKVIDLGMCRLPGQRFFKSNRWLIPVRPFEGQTLQDYISFLDGGIWVSINGRWKHKNPPSGKPRKSENELNQAVVPKNYYILHPPQT